MATNVYDIYFGNYTLVRNSDIKEAKRNWQKCLNDCQYFCGKTDGIFGPITQTQTRKFQENHKLTVDGKAGRYSKLAMLNIYLDDPRRDINKVCKILNQTEINGKDEGYNPDQQ